MLLRSSDSAIVERLQRLLRPGTELAEIQEMATPPQAGDAGGVLIRNADDAGWDHVKSGYRAWAHAAEDGCSAWMGGRVGLDIVADRSGPMPTVVSFYTIGTAYEQEANGLRECCERLGLGHDIRGLAPRGSWEANCAMKAAFVRDRWNEHEHGVVWIDADARIARHPDLFRMRGADFAIHLCNGWQFASGTVCFWKTRSAERLLDRWVAYCESDPMRWDQVSLDLAWESIVRTEPLTTVWLPQSYTKIFDHRPEDPCGPVIEHHQASRRLKQAVTSGASRPTPSADPDLIRARRAARPRPL